MKIMKKPIVLILCFAMLILLCVPAYAATPKIDQGLLDYLENAEHDAMTPLDISLDGREIRAAVEAAREEKYPEGITEANSDDYIMIGRNLAKELYTKMNTEFQEKYFNDECVIHFSSHYTGTILADVPKALVADIMASEQLSSLYLLTADLYEEAIPSEDTKPLEFDTVDVKTGDWFFDAVEYVYAAELMNGVDSYRFAPQDEVSRAMAITVLYRMAGSPPINWDRPPEDPFDDLEHGWYHNAVIWGNAYSIINGYGVRISDGVGYNLFGPDDSVTREQLVTMFWRAQGMPTADSDVLSGYADAAEISSWAVDAFAWAVDRGLIQGKPGGTLDPQGTTTRAELAQILMNSKA